MLAAIVFCYQTKNHWSNALTPFVSASSFIKYNYIKQVQNVLLLKSISYNHMNEFNMEENTFKLVTNDIHQEAVAMTRQAAPPLYTCMPIWVTREVEAHDLAC